MLMKKGSLLILLLITGAVAFSCPVCERQQPSALRGIVHGGGAQSNWDYVIIAVMTVIVQFTLFFSVKWLLYPGEKESSHIKHFILNNHEYEGR